MAKSHVVLYLGKPQTPLKKPAAAESDALPAANGCGLFSAAMNGFWEGKNSSLVFFVT